MNWRMKLADWISGGDTPRAAVISENARYERLRVRFEDCVLDRADCRAALRTIAAMETPSANATVRRMAKTAREAH